MRRWNTAAPTPTPSGAPCWTPIAKSRAASLGAAPGSRLSRWLVAWVGDCRVYRVGAADHEAAELLTRDDTYRHLDEASPPGGSPDDPARMIGNGAVDAPNVRQVDLRGGEI